MTRTTELHLHEVERDGDRLLLRIEGSLDGRTIEDFSARLAELVGPEVRIVIADLTSVTMISSHGLGALLALHKSLSDRKGEAVLAGTTGVPAMILYLTRLDKVFRRYASVEEARRSVGWRSR